jgi:hypothetical protein
MCTYSKTHKDIIATNATVTQLTSNMKEHGHKLNKDMLLPSHLKLFDVLMKKNSCGNVRPKRKGKIFRGGFIMKFLELSCYMVSPSR